MQATNSPALSIATGAVRPRFGRSSGLGNRRLKEKQLPIQAAKCRVLPGCCSDCKLAESIEMVSEWNPCRADATGRPRLDFVLPLKLFSCAGDACKNTLKLWISKFWRRQPVSSDMPMRPSKSIVFVASALALICLVTFLAQRVWRENGLRSLQAVNEPRVQLAANAVKAEISRQDHLPVVLSLDPDVRQALAAPRDQSLERQPRCQAQTYQPGSRHARALCHHSVGHCSRER